MTYPQPNFTQAIIQQAQDYWRLFTEIVTPGDIFESEQSALAMVLGPESDLANVRISYYDPLGLAPPYASSFAVTTERSFVGRVSASTNPYSVANKQGRILISVDDVYDTQYRPAGAGGGPVGIQRPKIDLMGYQGSLPSIVPKRRDANYLFNYVQQPAAPGDQSWLVYPYWGRRSGSWVMTNFTAEAITLTIRGVNFTTRTPAGGNESNETPLHGAALGAGVTVTGVITSFFDMIAVGITTGATNLEGPYSFRLTAVD